MLHSDALTNIACTTLTMGPKKKAEHCMPFSDWTFFFFALTENVEADVHFSHQKKQRWRFCFLQLTTITGLFLEHERSESRPNESLAAGNNTDENSSRNLRVCCCGVGYLLDLMLSQLISRDCIEALAHNTACRHSHFMHLMRPKHLQNIHRNSLGSRAIAVVTHIHSLINIQLHTSCIPWQSLSFVMIVFSLIPCDATPMFGRIAIVFNYDACNLFRCVQTWIQRLNTIYFVQISIA